MTEKRETRCPHCGAGFQIEEAQLQHAGGRVRCGSCLQIFDANTGEAEFIAPKIGPDTDINPLSDLSVKPMASADMPAPRSGAPKLGLTIAAILAVLLALQVIWRGNDAGASAGLEIGQLIVRKHPDRENALRLDAKLRNTSDRDLSFPAIELSLHNRYGEPRARRTFLPEEYLHGDWRASPRLPSRSEIQVSLALQDPGQDAVNYTARLRSVTDLAN